VASYSSGRSSNEAAYLLQLLPAGLGSNKPGRGTAPPLPSPPPWRAGRGGFGFGPLRC